VRVVVTGAAGFIGSHLTESLLADGHEVTGVDAFTDYYARSAKERNLEACRAHRAFRLVEGRLQDLDLRPLLEGAGQAVIARGPGRRPPCTVSAHAGIKRRHPRTSPNSLDPGIGYRGTL